MRAMTKTEIKQQAQHDLLHFAGSAFYQLNDGLADFDVDDTEAFEAYRRELDAQYKRMQKLFGYMPDGYKG